MRTALAAATVVVLAALGSQPTAAAGVRIERLAGAPPEWFTADFASEVVRAGAAGKPLPDDVTLRTSSLAFLGIRPGQQIIVTDSTDLTRARSISLCTSNFVFTDGTNYSIGTAGHCGNVGGRVFMIFAPVGVAYIGDIVYSTYSEDRLAPDFALISIRSEFRQWVSPSMAHWGGPTGAYTGNAIQPVVHSGHGLVIGTGGTPRAGVAYQWGDEWRFEGAVINGDSGSAANVVGGLAAGNITHVAVDTGDTVPAWMGGTRISKILSLISPRRLATCSLAIPWPAPGCPPV
jgi:hypothetical protein